MERALKGVVHHDVQSLRHYAMARTRNPAESDDLVQECLTRALVAVRNGHQIVNPQAYLFTILRNLISNSLSRQRRWAGILSPEFEAESLACLPQQTARMEWRGLVSGLNELPGEQKEILLLIGLDGLSYKMAAEALHIPIGTVMSRLNRGRSALKRILEGRTYWIPPPGARGPRH